MKGTKKVSYVGAVVLSLLLLATSINVLGTNQVSSETTINVVQRKSTPVNEPIQITGMKEPISYQNTQIGKTLGTDIQITSAESKENNPAIGVDPMKTYLLAYTLEDDPTSNTMPWGFSTDGQTFDPGVYFEIIGTESHPAIDYRGTANRLVGTLQGDPVESDGAIQYLFTCEDATNYDTYALVYWDWTSYPYSDRLIPDIGGYDSAGPAWWYGITACVGTRGSPGSVDMPIFNYMSYEVEDSGWSSYYAQYSGCEHVAVEADQTNGYFYAVFDYLNATLGHWDLLVFRGDCNGDGNTTEEHPLWFDTVLIGGPENTTHPAVAVQDNKVIILTQTDEAGTQDIVCYYSADAGGNWTKSVVAGNTENDELYPSIVSYGDYATCTFMMNGNLYVCYTEDAGATWTAPEQVNDENNMVQTEVRNSDITTDGTVVWTDLRNGNADVYLDNVGGVPPQPILEIGEITGGLGKVSTTVKNIGDADATSVNWEIHVTGGIFGRINSLTNGTIPTLAIGDEAAISTEGMIFGLGSLSITVTASCPQAAPPVVTKTATGKIFIVFIYGIV